MTTFYYVRTVRHDGSVILSRAFFTWEAANRWAKLAQQGPDAKEVTIVIRRQSERKPAA